MASRGELSSQEVFALFSEYVVANYRRYPACLVRGKGSEVWDAEGTRYLDLFAGWGCSLLGHSPARVVEAVREQVGELIHVPNTWHMQPQALLARALVQRSFPGQVFFCNSGAEANEAAIKLIRARQAPRYKVITAENSFHGRTFATLSATGQPKYQEGIGPLLPGFVHVPFNDVAAIAGAIDEETAAILVEPVQGEGGIIVPAPDYLAELRKLADERKLLLVLDEVQTGMGRTGKWFAFQHTGVEPDIMTVAKALAGGLACGAMVARPEIAASLKPGMHASTFGGNPVACRAGLATIETIESENLLERAVRIGEYFRRFFDELAHECSVIREVRVIGAMVGVELHALVAPVVEQCLAKRVLVNGTHDTVLRLLPALTISDDQLAQGAGVIRDVLMQLESP